MLNRSFGPPEDWPDQDLIAFSDELDAQLAATGYRCGVFPMPLEVPSFGGEMGWWSPMRRGVLPVSRLRVTRSMRASARHYATTIDRAFDRVLAQCANPDRPGGWIDDGIAHVYGQLHSVGLVHSVETWDADGALVGGLYGVSVGGLFAGESMFHDPVRGRDASKVALMRLVTELAGHDTLLDVQWATPHLRTLGAIEVSRSRYLALLDDALERPGIRWPHSEASHLDGATLLHRLEHHTGGGHA